MQDDRTYIKVFRKMLNWGWYGDTNTLRVFLHILLKANYEPSEYRGHKIGRGECVFGRRAWAKQLGMSERQVRTAIEHLKSTHEIAIRTTNKFSIITVVKWEFWQIEEGGATNKATHKKSNERPTTDQQPTTSKESKKVRNTTTHSKGHPKLDEIKAYVKENNLIIDAEYFYKYYEAAGWVDNKGKPIKNWKLKALNWNKREEERNGRTEHDARRSDKERTGVARTTVGSDYDYGKDAEKLPGMVFGVSQEE